VTKDDILYAKGYLYPMSPGLLTVDDDDDDVLEIDMSYHKVSVLLRRFSSSV
jgi:hypothetical protein